MWTAPYVVCSNDHLTAIRRRERAPSTTSNSEVTISALMSASASCGHTSELGFRPLDGGSKREQSKRQTRWRYQSHPPEGDGWSRALVALIPSPRALLMQCFALPKKGAGCPSPKVLRPRPPTLDAHSQHGDVARCLTEACYDYDAT